jgi:hypothetical protein
VVLGLDDSVGGAALSWDVTVRRLELAIRSLNPNGYLSRGNLRRLQSVTYRSTSSPLSFSIFANCL